MLLNTSGLFCLFHIDEPFHSEAAHAFRTGRNRFTHELVLAEFVALAHARRIP